MILYQQNLTPSHFCGMAVESFSHKERKVPAEQQLGRQCVSASLSRSLQGREPGHRQCCRDVSNAAWPDVQKDLHKME